MLPPLTVLSNVQPSGPAPRCPLVKIGPSPLGHYLHHIHRRCIPLDYTTGTLINNAQPPKAAMPLPESQISRAWAQKTCLTSRGAWPPTYTKMTDFHDWTPCCPANGFDSLVEKDKLQPSFLSTGPYNKSSLSTRPSYIASMNLASSG